MPSDFGVEPAPCDFGAVVFAGSAILGGFEGISFAGTFAVCCITLAVGGAAGDFAAGTDLGSLVRAAFFCAGSSVVAFATALVSQLLPLELQAFEILLLALQVSAILLSGLLLLEMVPFVLRPLLLGLGGGV